jgi:hypothetical protein
VREERKVAPKKRGAGGFVAALFGRAMSAAGAGGAQVTPSASRIAAQNSATPLGFASGIAEALHFTPTDPLEPSATASAQNANAQQDYSKVFK